MLKYVIVAAAIASGVRAQQAQTAANATVDSCWWVNGACDAPFCVNGASAMAVSCLSSDPTNGCPKGCELKAVDGIPEAQAGGVSRVCALQGAGGTPLPFRTAERLRNACGADVTAETLMLNPGGACTQASLALLVELGCTSSECQDDYINQAQRGDTCAKQKDERECAAVRMPCPEAATEVERSSSGARGALAAAAVAVAVAVVAAAL